tara:strand:- start:22511 stop:24634 length:2124 start_codon:yes stop_codon:yes gene_type:complete
LQIVWVLLIWLWVLSGQAEANDRRHGQPEAINQLPLIPGLMMFRDASAELRLEDVLAPERLSQWERMDEIPNLGLTTDHVWLAFGLEWSAGVAVRRWILQIQAPLLDRIDVYRIHEPAELGASRASPSVIDSARGRGGPERQVDVILAEAPNTATSFAFSNIETEPPPQLRWNLSQVSALLEQAETLQLRHYTVGASLPFDLRLIRDNNFSFLLLPDEGATDWVIMRVQSRQSMRVPMRLTSENLYVADVASTNLIQGSFFGLMAIMILTSIAVFVAIKDRAYIYYSIFVLSTVMFIFISKGYAYQFLWPDSADWNQRAFVLDLILGAGISVMFTRAFLRLPEHLPRFDVVLRILAWLWVLLGIYCLFGDYSTALLLTSIILPPGGTLLFIAGLIQVRKGYFEAMFYVAGWSALISGAVVFMLLEMGLIPANAMTLHAFQVGIAFEALILSIALAFRLQMQWQRRAAAEREALARLNQSQLQTIEAQKQTRVELELHVRERTQALEQTMAELADANRELKLLSTTDELTGLSNRRSINATLQREWSRGERQGTALSVLLLDLDHFKAVNDEYGHPFGDQALREVAKLLTSVVQRPSDLVGRWGGEEFMILLADATGPAAVTIAERIRQLIARTVVRHEAITINISVSIGVAATIPGNTGTGYSTPDLLVDAADRALYRAKLNGRNRVELMDEHGIAPISTDQARSQD